MNDKQRIQVHLEELSEELCLFNDEQLHAVLSTIKSLKRLLWAMERDIDPDEPFIALAPIDGISIGYNKLGS